MRRPGWQARRVVSRNVGASRAVPSYFRCMVADGEGKFAIPVPSVPSPRRAIVTGRCTICGVPSGPVALIPTSGVGYTASVNRGASSVTTPWRWLVSSSSKTAQAASGCWRYVSWPGECAPVSSSSSSSDLPMSSVSTTIPATARLLPRRTFPLQLLQHVLQPLLRPVALTVNEKHALETLVSLRIDQLAPHATKNFQRCLRIFKRWVICPVQQALS